MGTGKVCQEAWGPGPVPAWGPWTSPAASRRLRQAVVAWGVRGRGHALGGEEGGREAAITTTSGIAIPAGRSEGCGRVEQWQASAEGSSCRGTGSCRSSPSTTQSFRAEASRTARSMALPRCQAWWRQLPFVVRRLTGLVERRNGRRHLGQVKRYTRRFWGHPMTPGSIVSNASGITPGPRPGLTDGAGDPVVRMKPHGDEGQRRRRMIPGAAELRLDGCAESSSIPVEPKQVSALINSPAAG